MNNYLKNIVSDHQHGFITGRSTITNLVDFTTSAKNGITTHKQVDTIYLDLSKAFDSVDTNLLCHKLQTMGLNQQILHWIKSYLHNRKQIVKLDSKTMSKNVNVSSGVGQGYPIGATLFIMFVIDYPYYIKNSMLHIFADDSKLSKPISNQIDCEKLQEDLIAANEFFKINRLKLNATKSKQISFHRGNNPIILDYTVNNTAIERVSHIKDLGVIMNERMTYNNHIEHIIAKAKSRLIWIKRFSREFDDPWVIKRLFETFVLPIVEYASPIWSPDNITHINAIESIQKQFLIFALRKFKWQNRFQIPPYRHRLLFFHMNTLEDRRTISQILFILSIINYCTTSSQLLSSLCLRIPINFNIERFTRNRQNTNQIILSTTQSDDPFNKMKIKFNLFYEMFDLNDSNENVKNILKSYFKSQNL